MFMYDALLEYGGRSAIVHLHTFGPAMLRLLQDPNPVCSAPRRRGGWGALGASKAYQGGQKFTRFVSEFISSSSNFLLLSFIVVDDSLCCVIIIYQRKYNISHYMLLFVQDVCQAAVYGLGCTALAPDPVYVPLWGGVCHCLVGQEVVSVHADACIVSL